MTGGRAAGLKVAVVDDSAVVRGLVGRWLEESGAEVVARLRNGREAVERMGAAAPDVVLLDVEMPDMDGLTALPEILKAVPGVAVIMASTLTRRGAETTMRALALGAADYLAKPESRMGPGEAEAYRAELIAKVEMLGVKARGRRRPGAAKAAMGPREVGAAAIMPSGEAPVMLRPIATGAARILLVGSSTGGPQALVKLFGLAGPKLERVPVLVTQHMPPAFTALLADHIGRVAGRPSREARDGDLVQPGTILVAPGGFHMRLVKSETGPLVRLDDGPQINFCRPSVDPMFETAAALYGPGALALVLTGMGHDGTDGARRIVAAGGNVLAQDEATSVVWGMPGAVARAGLAGALAPVEELARLVVQRL